MLYLLIILCELIITVACILGLNHYTFATWTIDPRPIYLLLRHWWKHLSWRYVLVLTITLFCWLVSIIICKQIFGKVHRHKLNQNKHSHGTAAWASDKDMSDLGFCYNRKELQKRPLVLLAQSNDAQVIEQRRRPDQWRYRKQGKALIGFDFASSPAHLLLVSLTRGGKGTGTITSTLLSWPDSVMVFDPKGENYANTAGYRATFSDVYRIDPVDPDGCHVNPLDWIRTDANFVNDIVNFAYILLPENPNDNQPFFDRNGRDIIVLLLMYVLWFSADKTIAGAYRVLTDNGKNFSKTFKQIGRQLAHYAGNDRLMDMALKKALNDANRFAGMAESTLESCVASALTPLSLFARPTIEIVTSETYFALEQLMDSDRPISIYITVAIADIEATAPFSRLLFSAINRRLMAKRETQAPRRHNLLMLIDEFAQLGRFKEIEQSIGVAAGYGICYILAIQSIGQLQTIYGRDNVKIFFDNSMTALLKVQDPDSTKYFSNMLGPATIVLNKANKSGDKDFIGSKSWSINTSEVGKPLMAPDEIRSKSGDRIIVIIPARKPYIGKRILFFEEKHFRGKTGLPVPVKTSAPISSVWQNQRFVYESDIVQSSSSSDASAEDSDLDLFNTLRISTEQNAEQNHVMGDVII